jgi:hypothetical protein
MLRAVVESALKEKGITNWGLEDKIKEALKRKIITEQEGTLAMGTKLIGDDSIHKASVIKLVEVQGLFGAVVQIVDKVFP